MICDSSAGSVDVFHQNQLTVSYSQRGEIFVNVSLCNLTNPASEVLSSVQTNRGKSACVRWHKKEDINSHRVNTNRK